MGEAITSVVHCFVYKLTLCGKYEVLCGFIICRRETMSLTIGLLLSLTKEVVFMELFP